MKELEKKTEEQETEMLQQKIIAILSKIHDVTLLERIYRFTKFIYIHKTK